MACQASSQGVTYFSHNWAPSFPFSNLYSSSPTQMQAVLPLQSIIYQTVTKDDMVNVSGVRVQGVS